MKKLKLSNFVLLTVSLTLFSCDSSEPSTEDIIRDAQSRAAEIEVNSYAAQCNSAENSQETNFTYVALQTKTQTTSCDELARFLLNIQELDLSQANIQDLSPLAPLTSLSVLDLSENRIEDISPLSNLRNLSSLNISDNLLTDISPVQSMLTLANLNASLNEIEDVDSLSNLFNLLSLNLEGNQISDISALKNLTKLVEFKFQDNILGFTLEKTPENCPLDIDAASAIREYCNLRNQVRTFYDYCINYDNEAADIQLTIDRLKGGLRTCEEANEFLTTQTTLDLSVPVIDINLLTPDPNVQRLTNIWPIASLVNLEELRLDFNAITDVEPISYLENLRGLFIRGNGISDISSFTFLEQVVILDMAVNKISDISPLRQMKILTGLVLNLNQVVDISPIENLNFLTGIGLQFNLVKDISSLSQKSTLRVLDLSYNEIESYSSLLDVNGLTSFNNACNEVGTTIIADNNNCPTSANTGDLLRTACEDMPTTAEAMDDLSQDCNETRVLFQVIRSNLFEI